MLLAILEPRSETAWTCTTWTGSGQPSAPLPRPAQVIAARFSCCSCYSWCYLCSWAAYVVRELEEGHERRAVAASDHLRRCWPAARLRAWWSRRAFTAHPWRRRVVIHAVAFAEVMRRGDRRRWRPRTGRLPLWVLQVRSHGNSASPLLLWAATPPRRSLCCPPCYAVSSSLFFSVSLVRLERSVALVPTRLCCARSGSLKRQLRHAARAASNAREWLASSTDCPPSCDPVFPLCVRAQCRSQCENARETKIERLLPGLQAQAGFPLPLDSPLGPQTAKVWATLDVSNTSLLST